jgi:hypothetical protein
MESGEVGLFGAQDGTDVESGNAARSGLDADRRD